MSTTTTRERPILFSGPMVRAILEGRKTQTRRVVKHIPALGAPEEWCHRAGSVEFSHIAGPYQHFCPYGHSGDRLWVKETYCEASSHMEFGRKIYRADIGETAKPPLWMKWKPSIFCTRIASRITLEITGVRVERLKDCSEADAIAEGIDHREFGDGSGTMLYRVADNAWENDPVAAYRTLWESINGPGSWAQNPWVWVVEFKRVEVAS